jgi:hypothetical protein
VAQKQGLHLPVPGIWGFCGAPPAAVLISRRGTYLRCDSGFVTLDQLACKRICLEAEEKVSNAEGLLIMPAWAAHQCCDLIDLI